MSTIFLPQQQLLVPLSHFHFHRSTPCSGITTLSDYPVPAPKLWVPSPLQVSKHKNRLNPVSCNQGACSESHESMTVALTHRRAALINILLSSLAFPFAAGSAAAADTEEKSFRTYEDKVNKFSILIPREWLMGSGGESTNIKSITAFYPEETTESNVSILITPLGPDFTKLGSFGKVDEFAETLVSGLDRSWQRPPGAAAKLIDSKAANGLYYIEYTLQNPGERKRHIISALGIASTGWYNRLYTVSGQFIEDDSEKYRQQIQKSVSSFQFVRDADAKM